MKLRLNKFMIALMGLFLTMIFVLAPVTASANVSNIAEVANELHPPTDEISRELSPDAAKLSPKSNDETLAYHHWTKAHQKR